MTVYAAYLYDININDFIKCAVNVRIFAYFLTVHWYVNLVENIVCVNSSSINVALVQLIKCVSNLRPTLNKFQTKWKKFNYVLWDEDPYFHSNKLLAW